jgi:hypothetical protein
MQEARYIYLHPVIEGPTVEKSTRLDEYSKFIILKHMNLLFSSNLIYIFVFLKKISGVWLVRQIIGNTLLLSGQHADK